MSFVWLLIILKSESDSVVSNSSWPHGLYSPRSSPGQNTGVGSFFLLQRIFPTQESNQGPALQETWIQSLAWEDPLKKKMATHSSILAWESHGQRSLVGYSPWAQKRVRHNWATKQQQQINLGGGLRSRVLMIPLWQVSVKSYVRSGSVLNDKLKPDSSLRKHLAEVEQDGKGWQTRAC